MTIVPADLLLFSTLCQSKLGTFEKQYLYTGGYLGFAVKLQAHRGECHTGRVQTRSVVDRPMSYTHYDFSPTSEQLP